MKLFDLLPNEKISLNRFLAWHFGYFVFISVFFLIIFEYGWFKSHWLLKETGIINVLAPSCTLLFVILSPFRRNWLNAIVNMYKALDGELVFCLMAVVVFLLGFYLYSVLFWLLAGMIPGILYS